MEITAKQLAAILNGTCEGKEDVLLSKIAKIEEGEIGAISFLSNPKYTEYIYQTASSAVIVSNDFVAEKAMIHNPTLIRVSDPRMSLAQLLNFYTEATKVKPEIAEQAFVHPTAKIGKDCYIGAFVYIGANAVIGDFSVIESHAFIGNEVRLGHNCHVMTGAKVLARCVVGSHCTLQPASVIGGDGFGFTPNSDNNYQKMPHIGNVILEDHVEIGANTTIDRATMGSTIIRKGVKLDNLIQVAHNVEIGENTVIAAQTGIAGSTKIGKNCMIGGQVGIVGHIEIADEVKIAAQSGIGQSITEKGAIVQGSPAFAIGDYKRSYVLFRSLPALKAKIDELIKNITP